MAYTVPTVGDFKRQFQRDFPFAVPSFGASPGAPNIVGGVLTGLAAGQPGQGYNAAPKVVVKDAAGTGAIVTAAAPVNGGVPSWNVVAGGTGYVAPTFEVTGGSGDNTDLTRVTDDDLAGAIADANLNVNQGLFGTQADYARAFLFLSAHNLVQNLLSAGEGMRSRGKWLVSTSSVGDVSESFEIPERIKEDPYLASISKTRYGMRYLEAVTPLITGNFGTFFRQTPP